MAAAMMVAVARAPRVADKEEAPALDAVALGAASLVAASVVG